MECIEDKVRVKLHFQGLKLGLGELRLELRCFQVAGLARLTVKCQRLTRSQNETANLGCR